MPSNDAVALPAIPPAVFHQFAAPCATAAVAVPAVLRAPRSGSRVGTWTPSAVNGRPFGPTTVNPNARSARIVSSDG